MTCVSDGNVRTRTVLGHTVLQQGIHIASLITWCSCFLHLYRATNLLVKPRRKMPRSRAAPAPARSASGAASRPKPASSSTTSAPPQSTPMGASTPAPQQSSSSWWSSSKPASSAQVPAPTSKSVGASTSVFGVRDCWKQTLYMSKAPRCHVRNFRSFCPDCSFPSIRRSTCCLPLPLQLLLLHQPCSHLEVVA